MGAIPSGGPGVSPVALKQFFAPKRDTSAQSGVIGGSFVGTSLFTGNLTGTSAHSGNTYGTSLFTGQLTGSGNMPGNFISASTFFGTLSQPTTLLGAIPRGGPGISPASMFQFSTLELDSQNFPILLGNGQFQSASTFFGQPTGTAALSGISTSTSLFRGNLTAVGGVGALTGNFISTSSFFGPLVAGGPGALTGQFVSTSVFTGALSGIVTPVGPGVCTNLWSADGNYKWTADGFTGWSADGYEPNPLSCAVTYLANVGVNVGTLTYAYNALVPAGYVITGYVPFIDATYAGQYIPLLISLGPAPQPKTYTVPNLVGKFYYDAQLAILDASFYIAPPIWGFAPPGTSVGPVVTIDSTIVTIDSTLVTIDGFDGVPVIPVTLPQYVYAQSIAAGTVFTQPVQISINVQGFPTVNQPNVPIAVP